MNLTLKIWRQKNANDKGKMVDYQIADVSPDMSFLEMLDVLNEQLNLWPLITIVVRVFAGCVPYILMEKHMVQIEV